LPFNLADLFELVADAVPERVAGRGRHGVGATFAELRRSVDPIRAFCRRGARPAAPSR